MGYDAATMANTVNLVWYMFSGFSGDSRCNEHLPNTYDGSENSL